MLQEAKAYVDGSFYENEYGYGVYLLYKDEIYKLYGKGSTDKYTEMRNVSGEIVAAMMAIQKAIKLKAGFITIYYDYMGIEKWANNEWDANKKGTQYYKNFIKEARKSIEINFKKVKGHSGNEGNEIADQLAKKGLGIQ